MLLMRPIFRGLLLTLIGLPLLLQTGFAAAEEVNIYSARKEELIKPLLDKFQEQTGIKVNMVTGKADALLKRLQSEGRNSPADLLLTTDVGRLHRAKSAGVTQEFESSYLDESIPANFRDPQHHWYGLSVRARPIMYSPDRVKPEQLSTYEALADPAWKGRICIRSSGNIYNQSLVASMIAANGVEATEKWADGFVGNFARPPRGGDRDQIKAAAAGQCDIAIANTYYLAGMLQSKDPAQQQAAARVAVFWPNQEGRGTHVNISGIALTKSSRNKENAIKLVEYLASESAQKWYADANGEYPVKRGIQTSSVLNNWGAFRMDLVNLGQLGELNPQAVRLMDRAGWK